jgi:hypothetical protein
MVLSKQSTSFFPPKFRLLSKGGDDAILAKSSGTEQEIQIWREDIERLAQNGFRTLCVGMTNENIYIFFVAKLNHSRFFSSAERILSVDELHAFETALHAAATAMDHREVCYNLLPKLF